MGLAVDSLSALLIVASAVRGFWRGLVREVMAFAGLGVGMMAAARWHSGLAEHLHPLVGGGSLVSAFAYLLLVLLSLGIATALTVLVQRMLGLLSIRWLDRLGGIFFGACLGAITVVILFILAVRYPHLGSERLAGESTLARELLGAVRWTATYLPPELSSVAGFFQVP
jgi:membrane protein required for colicin V production